MIQIVHQRIDLDALLGAGDEGAREAAARAGGVVLFLGTVRGETRGRQVRRLEYEAFEAMALDELEAVAAAARRRHAIQEIHIVHRVGTLEVGEVAVAILVRAAHRQAAFDACSGAIDQLKKTVPIWKKEFFEDGAVWVGDRP